MKIDTNTSDLYQTVIQGGFCVGCGACASMPESGLRIQLNAYGQFQATPTADQIKPNATNNNVAIVCPFADKSLDEDTLSNEFLSRDLAHDSRVGKYSALMAGYIDEGAFRANGSSGGVVSWLLCELMRNGDIDGALHIHTVDPAIDSSGLLFRYGISRSLEDIQAGSKSRYYAIEMSDVIAKVRAEPGKYAIVGVPCFIKAVRLLMHVDPILKERIKYCISIVCGHLKSSRFAELLSMQMGIPPDRLHSINFRHKLSTGGASHYGVSATDKDHPDNPVIHTAKDLFGSDWGMGFLKYQACDFCDDVFGETADLTAGDAWYTKFANDPRGANVVVIRNSYLENIVRSAISAGHIFFEDITPDQMARTQQSGLRHRREGLSYRLHMFDKASVWRPSKRVPSNSCYFKSNLRTLHATRMTLARDSHPIFLDALKAHDFGIFLTRMQLTVNLYVELYRDPDRIKKLWYSASAPAKSIVKSTMKFFGLLKNR